ncbi:MAG: signal peptidase I [Opitutaceae bacterium]|nr:signal peptidase I [Opitutaceae bacterium]
MRQNAANWLHLAEKVYHYRRDQLNAGQERELQTATSELKVRLRDRADASRLKLAIESLERVLRNVGGRIYPMSTFVENVEFFLVAAIVVLGLRAFFIQPFKIPTNSMWPSYYGMTHELTAADSAPGAVGRLWRFATLGARHYQATVPAGGELLIPVFGNGYMAYSEKTGRTAGIIPSTKREYSFMVGGQVATLTVPRDFDLEKVVDELLSAQGYTNLRNLLGSIVARKESVRGSTMLITQGGLRSEQSIYWLPTGRMVKAGEPAISFDILTGDMLFVDRLSYNFVRPRVGQGFVFRTGHIDSPLMESPPGSGRQIDQYYIKRLVGVPDDTLEIREPVLFRNGQPITGAAAFAFNALRQNRYPGYRNNQTGQKYLAAAGERITVPPRSYFAMGDNSANSLDSRFWGVVPEKDVVGRPLFIYYPFSFRWGIAR